MLRHLASATVAAARRRVDVARATRTFASGKALEDEVNDAFAEAREEIEAAMESVGSTYFNEDAEHARACVEKTMAAYEKLLESAASEDARGRVRRSMGLKMEQLRGELKMMDSAHDDH